MAVGLFFDVHVDVAIAAQLRLRQVDVLTAQEAQVSRLPDDRRLGNFSGAGEHARQGGRDTGIVGQAKQRNRTDKSAKK